MGAFVESVQVGVPLRTAYDQWVQFETFPRFMSVVKAVHQERPAITRWTLKRGLLRHEFHAEILEQHPDSRVEWRSLERRFRHEGAVVFDALGPDRTEVRAEIRFEAPWHSEALLLPVVQRLVRAELQHFKTFIEGMGEAGEAAWRGTIHDGRVEHTYNDSPSVPGWPHG